MDRKFKKLTYLCSIKNGVLIYPDRMNREIKGSPDHEDLRITIDIERTPKTYEQIKAFHGPVCEQVQTCIMEQEGEYWSLDKVKENLKTQFLKPQKQYYTDGSPVVMNLPHPERKGVFYRWHYERVPSLSELSVEQMRSFIDEIIAHFWHERGYKITINEKTS